MGSAVSFSYGARGPHPRALGALAPRAGRGRSAGADERDDFVRTEARARCQGQGWQVGRIVAHMGPKHSNYSRVSRVDSMRASDTLGCMELNVPPDLETKLARAADRRGMAAEALVLEAIERAVEYDDWFLREVEKGLAQIERGDVLTHEEVGARLERRLTETRTRP